MTSKKAMECILRHRTGLPSGNRKKDNPAGSADSDEPAHIHIHGQCYLLFCRSVFHQYVLITGYSHNPFRKQTYEKDAVLKQGCVIICIRFLCQCCAKFFTGGQRCFIREAIAVNGIYNIHAIPEAACVPVIHPGAIAPAPGTKQSYLLAGKRTFN